jgi:hypothetical protein
MTGQNVFDSGWEWGYWLQGVIAARGAYNPYETEREREGENVCVCT